MDALANHDFEIEKNLYQYIGLEFLVLIDKQ